MQVVRLDVGVMELSKLPVLAILQVTLYISYPYQRFVRLLEAAAPQPVSVSFSALVMRRVILALSHRSIYYGLDTLQYKGRFTQLSEHSSNTHICLLTLLTKVYLTSDLSLGSFSLILTQLFQNLSLSF